MGKCSMDEMFSPHTATVLHEGDHHHRSLTLARQVMQMFAGMEGWWACLKYHCRM